MTTAVQKGLAASRHVLDNGTVVVSKDALSRVVETLGGK